MCCCTLSYLTQNKLETCWWVGKEGRNLHNESHLIVHQVPTSSLLSFHWQLRNILIRSSSSRLIMSGWLIQFKQLFYVSYFVAVSLISSSLWLSEKMSANYKTVKFHLHSILAHSGYFHSFHVMVNVVGKASIATWQINIYETFWCEWPKERWEKKVSSCVWRHTQSVIN